MGLNIAAILLSVFSCIVNIIILLYLVFLNKPKKQEIVKKDDNTEKIKLLLENKSLEKINDVVEGIIKESVDRYMILNVNYDTDAYLNEATINELSLYTFGMVKNNMTPAVRELIGLTHDISTEDKLDDLLKLHIKMYILAFVVKTNQ